MFSSKERLAKRTPNNGIDRESYIRLLADEYYETTNLEAKIQVTANLANFAYDPINYEYLLRSDVPKLFVELLGTCDNHLVLNGIAGICNCCLYAPIRHNLIDACNAIDAITLLLHQHHHRPDDNPISPQLLIQTLTTLVQLHTVNQTLCSRICTPTNIRCVRVLQQTRQKKRTTNDVLATICASFLSDYGAHSSHNDAVTVGVAP